MLFRLKLTLQVRHPERSASNQHLRLIGRCSEGSQTVQ